MSVHHNLTLVLYRSYNSVLTVQVNAIIDYTLSTLNISRIQCGLMHN